MANVAVKNASASTVYLKATGAGSDPDPHIVEHLDTNSAAILAALQAIQTAVQLIDNMIAGSEGQVDVVAALPAGSNQIGDVVVNNIEDGAGDSVMDATNNAVRVNVVAGSGPFPITDNSGSLTVDGTVTVQDGGGAITVDDGAGSLTVDGTVTANLSPTTSGGLSIFRSIDLDETEEEVKGSAGQLYGAYLYNAASSGKRYVKVYNATAANVTVGTTTPVLTLPLDAGQGAVLSFEHGLAFSTAITVAATTGVADSDTGAPGANEVVVNVFYK